MPPRPRKPAPPASTCAAWHPLLADWSARYGHLREVTATDVAVIGLDDTTAIRYAAAARHLLDSAAERHTPG